MAKKITKVTNAKLPRAATPRVSAPQKAEKTNNIKTETNCNATITAARKETYLADDMAGLLIEQIGLEFNNYFLYRNFAIWYDLNSYFGQAAYFNHRAEEEKNHAQWIIDYLSRADYLFAIPAVDHKYIDIYNGRKILTVRDPHEDTIVREIETTRAINRIKAKAIETHDYITDHWLRDLLLEQAEEEETSHTALDIFDHTDDPLIVDNYFKNVIMPQLAGQ